MLRNTTTKPVPFSDPLPINFLTRVIPWLRPDFGLGPSNFLGES